MQHAISLGTAVIPRRYGDGGGEREGGGGGRGVGIRCIMGDVQVANKRFTERR